MVGAVFTRAGVDSKLPNYFFNFHDSIKTCRIFKGLTNMRNRVSQIDFLADTKSRWKADLTLTNTTFSSQQSHYFNVSPRKVAESWRAACNIQEE